MEKQHYPLNNPYSYIRVQTTFYKKVAIPTINGDYLETWMPWTMEALKQDLRPSQVKKIPRYDGFCCVPDHLEFKEVIGNFFNRYHRLDWEPQPGECSQIKTFLQHIFGEQYELGLDYISLLYTKPIQKLPVLCLVSKERKTGKTTFLNLLKLIFGKNMTFNGNQDFRSQFNADWISMLIVAVEEVLLERKEDSERIKNLSTAKGSKMEAKSKDKREVDYFGKFVFCSNNEENFIIIDPTETRYWVRKVPLIPLENVEQLEVMKAEIPAFLYYLLQRPLSVPTPLSRMWFSEQQIRTVALLRVIRNNRNKVETEILLLLQEIFDTTGREIFEFANKDLLELVRKQLPRIGRQDITKVLQDIWDLQPVPNSMNYETLVYNTCNELIPAHYKGRYYTITVQWMRQKFDDSA